MTPHTQADELHYCVGRFSAFQQVLRISGWLYSPHASIMAVSLHIPGERRKPVAHFTKPSPDVAAVYGAGASNVGFDEVVEFMTPSANVCDAVLVVEREGLPPRRIGNLGRMITEQTESAYMRFLADLESREPGRILEIGSRARSGITRRQDVPEGWHYTGLDVREGPNVDIVGDAHKLSQTFPPDHFDAFMSFAVFEHLMMPWKVIIELNRVLRIGAIGYIIAPQTWPVHEMPWDYFRFSEAAWMALLNKATGFEIVEATMGEPSYIVPQRLGPGSNFGEFLRLPTFRRAGQKDREHDPRLARRPRRDHRDVLSRDAGVTRLPCFGD
jgi:hypothetical protein